MNRLEPIPREDLPDYEPMFQLIEASMGFVPTSMRVMAKVPSLLDAFSGLAGTVMSMNKIDLGLGQLIANVASHAAGCRYCQAHTGAHAAQAGVAGEKVANVWEFETSDLFSEAERAALRVARDAAQVPNAVTDESFAALSEHYDEEQIVQIVATISLFGYLNRWNDTMATSLEAEPNAFASEHFGGAGWEPGKHASGD